MAKSSSVYQCQNCGHQQSKWSGQCPECGEWNSLVEGVASPTQHATRTVGARVQRLAEIDVSKANFARLEVGSGELTQVLGGGLVIGSVILLAGQPGIGKSTLLSQMTLYFASKYGPVLYVCGEESVQQVKLRLERISAHKSTSKTAKDNILLLPETSADAIVAQMQAEKPVLTIVDSVQTLTSEGLSGMAGSVGQVRESGNRILKTAKLHGLSTFIVGHVTKSGNVAGPKVLEHMVDAVLQLEGERSGQLRLLRAMKNRFGAVDEVGVFSMDDAGLKDVTNLGQVFVDQNQTEAPGSALTVLMEGTRPMVAEIQALVVSSGIPTPRRVAEGIKLSRLHVICAVLEKHAKIRLGDKDIFVNAVGGIKAHEPAADLAIAAAIASSAQGKALAKKQVLIGEVGLLGEVRIVSYWERRKREAEKMGYTVSDTVKRVKDIV